MDLNRYNNVGIKSLFCTSDYFNGFFLLNYLFTPLSTTDMVELNGQLLAPILGLKEESKKIYETQVLIPYTVGDVTYAFGGLR